MRRRAPTAVIDRDPRIDVLRAVCVLSMTVGHLLGGTMLSTVLHPFVFVDGAAGFVACSAVVLGMVQRRSHDRGRAVAGHRLLLRRLSLLYGVHVGLVATAVLARTWVDRPPFVPSIDDLGGFGEAVWRILALQVQPPFLNVLPLYVFLLVLAHPLVLLARHRLALVALAASAAFYWWNRTSEAFTGPELVWGAPTTFSWGAWQLLFVCGVLVGWHWHTVRRIAGSPLGPPAVALAAATAVALGVVAQAWRLGNAPYWIVVWLEKYSFQPGMLLFTAAVAVTGYWLVGRAGRSRTGTAVNEVLATIGVRPFFCFLCLLVAEIVVRSIAEELSTEEGAAVALIVLVLGWSGGAAKQRRRLTAGAPDPATAAPAPPARELVGAGAASSR